MVKRKINTNKRIKKYNKTKKIKFNELKFRASAKAYNPNKRKADSPDIESAGSSDTLPECPEYMKCPISLDLMNDPVIAEDGRTYDRSSITTACRLHPISPFTRNTISCNFITNRNMRDVINEFLSKYGRDELPPPVEPSEPVSIVSQAARPAARGRASRASAAARRVVGPRGAVGQRRSAAPRTYTPPRPTTSSDEEYDYFI